MNASGSIFLFLCSVKCLGWFLWQFFSKDWRIIGLGSFKFRNSLINILNCWLFKVSNPYIRTMAERRLWDWPRKAGASGTAISLPLTIFQCCTNHPGVKCVQAQAFLFRAVNSLFKSALPLEEKCNKVPTWTSPPGEMRQARTDLRVTTNVNQNIKEDHQSASIFFQAIPSVVFQPNIPEFSPNVLTDR